MRVFDVFLDVFAECTREVRSNAFAQFCQILTFPVFCSETLLATEDVVIDDAGQAVQLQKGVLERGRRKKEFLHAVKGIADGYRCLCRGSINIAKFVGFVDDGKVKAMRQDIRLVLPGKVVAAYYYAFGRKRILPFLNVSIVVLGVQDFALDTEFIL